MTGKASPATYLEGKSRVSMAAIAVLVATLGAFTLNGGFLYPANAFRLDQLGYSTSVIGAMGAVGACGYVAGSVMAPFLAGWLGLRRAAILSILGTAALIFAFAIVPPILAWYPMRLVHGITTTVLYVCGETALIAIAPAELRGRIIGFYTAVNSLFFVAGPGVVALLGFASVLPYGLVAITVGLLAFPMAFLSSVTPELPTVPLRRLMTSVASIPALLAAVALWGWLDGSVINLFGIYAVKRGATVADAALLFSLGPLGNVILQFPIGWLADHVSRRVLLAGLSGTGFLLALALPFLDLSGHLIMAHLILFGAVGFGTFTVSLIALGDALTGSALVVANAAFGICWGLGSFAGSAITGSLMDIVGQSGFPLALAAGFLIQCVAVITLPMRAAEVS